MALYCVYLVFFTLAKNKILNTAPRATLSDKNVKSSPPKRKEMMEISVSK